MTNILLLKNRKLSKSTISDKLPREYIRNYQDICDELGVSSDDSNMQIQIEEFDDSLIFMMRNVAKAIRIAKVYNKGWLPKKGEERYYAWFEFSDSSPSGLVFHHAYCDAGHANAASAAHLCFQNREDVKDAAIKFTDIYAGIILHKV